MALRLFSLKFFFKKITKICRHNISNRLSQKLFDIVHQYFKFLAFVKIIVFLSNILSKFDGEVEIMLHHNISRFEHVSELSTMLHFVFSFFVGNMNALSFWSLGLYLIFFSSSAIFIVSL